MDICKSACLDIFVSIDTNRYTSATCTMYTWYKPKQMFFGATWHDAKPSHIMSCSDLQRMNWMKKRMNCQHEEVIEMWKRGKMKKNECSSMETKVSTASVRTALGAEVMVLFCIAEVVCNC